MQIMLHKLHFSQMQKKKQLGQLFFISILLGTVLNISLAFNEIFLFNFFL